MKRNFVALSDSSPGYRETPLEWLPAHTDRVFEVRPDLIVIGGEILQNATQLRFVEHDQARRSRCKAVEISH